MSEPSYRLGQKEGRECVDLALDLGFELNGRSETGHIVLKHSALGVETQLPSRSRNWRQYRKDLLKLVKPLVPSLASARERRHRAHVERAASEIVSTPSVEAVDLRPLRWAKARQRMLDGEGTSGNFGSVLYSDAGKRQGDAPIPVLEGILRGLPARDGATLGSQMRNEFAAEFGRKRLRDVSIERQIAA